MVVSPRKQSVQRSSIQERISYGKVSSSTSFGGQSPRSNDFKVPSTIQRNDNSVELIDLTDDASESNTSSITTTQEELYSYLGVVTKTQTNKVETETENKTVKRSSLRVKVKQIALRNQEIYNQLENNRKLEAARAAAVAAAAANTQSLVRYNGHRTIEQSSVQVRRHNGDPRQNHYASKQQQYTQSTYKSTTLVNNNATSTQQPSRNNYRPVQTNRVNRQQYESSSSSSSYQIVPYSFKPQTRITTNKCTVMERFVYKSNHVVDEPPNRPIQVNADKYKPVSSSSHSSTATTTTVNRIMNGHQQIGSRSPVRKPEILATRDKPPQITPGIKRKAMEQWMELSSTHPTSTNSLQSKVNSNTSSSSSSFTSFHQQNTTTTTNISTHRKVQKLDVIYVKNQSSSNTFQTNSQPNSNAGAGIVSPLRKIQMDPRKVQVRSNPVQNVSTANGLLSPRIPQQNASVNRNVVQSAPIESTSSKIIRPSNALALQTCSQKNIGNNRVASVESVQN